MTAKTGSIKRLKLLFTNQITISSTWIEVVVLGMKLTAQIESMLFVSAKPLSVRKIADLAEQSAEKVRAALDELKSRLDKDGSGVMLQELGQEVELATRPEANELVRRVIKTETQGELTRPSIEALTILAYRGPMTRPELEQIRGVQSALILRNLMLRGLVEEQETGPLGLSTYAVTFDFLNALGLKSVTALPQYEELRGHTVVQELLADLEKEKDN